MNQEHLAGEGFEPQPPPVEPQTELNHLLKQIEPLFKAFQENKTTMLRINLESHTVIKKQELETLDKLDKRDKWYKAVVIGLCLITLAFTVFIDKMNTISPVIGVIIGLVLKSNSLGDFLGNNQRPSDNNN